VSLLNLGIDLPTWIIVLIGGVIGAVLVAVLFDWALILMSSLIGANLVVQAIDPAGWFATMIFVGLFVVGVIIQAKTKRS
jgi:H+/Cl- antiporter ClcA